MKKFVPLFLIIIIIPLFLLSFRKIYPIKYKDIIVEYSERYNISPELISSVINAESGFDRGAVSSAGAIGLMQVLPSTAKEIGGKLGYKEYDLYNVKINIEFGCYYFRYLLDIYNQDVVMSLCAYNAGLNNVKYWGFNGEIDKIPVIQTKNYVKKIVKTIQVYKVFYY